MGARTGTSSGMCFLWFKGRFETDHLIPRNRGGDESFDNLVLACRSCNTSRGDKGIFEWLGLKRRDNLHRLVAGKYLKQLLQIHEVKGTLEISKTELKKALPDLYTAAHMREMGEGK